jgi:site-specific DNA-methyltransferase (adenine-specific)
VLRDAGRHWRAAAEAGRVKPYTLHLGDCLDVLRGMADNSVDSIVTDPPYFRVKGDAWDNQWATPDVFIAWIDTHAEQWARVLKPNGSLWVFASPQMAARVEVTIARRFSILNHIKWRKPSGRHLACQPADLRSFFPQTEAIIFAEHFGSDNIAKGEAGYEAKCDELRGFVFEPLRVYLASERDRAGFTTRQVAEAFQAKQNSRTVTGMAGHWFEAVQWALPTAGNYRWLRELFGPNGLRREYEDLRREYEDLRRPFALKMGDPHTDVWDFGVVQAYDGKHPCEKPNDLMRHIIATSTRPGAVVFDGFMGSGSTGIAAVQLGRQFIGCEMAENHFAQATARIELAGSLEMSALRLLRKPASERDAHTVDLFSAA